MVTAPNVQRAGRVGGTAHCPYERSVAEIADCAGSCERERRQKSSKSFQLMSVFFSRGSKLAVLC